MDPVVRIRAGASRTMGVGAEHRCPPTGLTIGRRYLFLYGRISRYEGISGISGDDTRMHLRGSPGEKQMLIFIVPLITVRRLGKTPSEDPVYAPQHIMEGSILVFCLRGIVRVPGTSGLSCQRGGMKDVSVRGIRSSVLSSSVAIAEIRMSVSIGMEGEHEP